MNFYVGVLTKRCVKTCVREKGVGESCFI